ncbi:MAG: PTS sugar transporter subunit IIA [Caulobacterales bacterium]|nr:PTS sugar transporter subunit IIA [Caulobacterales bacterium]
MIGIVLVSHGRLAEELVSAAEHVVGRLAGVRALSIDADDDMERRRADIRAALEEVDVGRGVIVLTDMFGGTPANLAISLMKAGRVEVLAGANLPMLIKLAEARENADLAVAAEAALTAGRKYIAMASQVLSENGS